MTEPTQIVVPPGHIAVTSWGAIQMETTQSLLALQARLIHLKIQAKWNFVPGALVDKARNESARVMMLDAGAGYLLMLDADMTFDPTIVEMLLATAYRDCPWADIVGGWCPLRGEPYLPTMDTGTGQWESLIPNQGPIEVIRTGGACLLIKRHVFERMEAPWFGVRPVPRVIDTLAEFDNFCRTKFNGENPFREMREWTQITQCAMDEARQQIAMNPDARYAAHLHSVGEDSNFCDKARALGFRIVVQTHAVCGHVDRRVITAADHVASMKKVERQEWLACGVTG